MKFSYKTVKYAEILNSVLSNTVQNLKIPEFKEVDPLLDEF